MATISHGRQEHTTIDRRDADHRERHHVRGDADRRDDRDDGGPDRDPPLDGSIRLSPQAGRPSARSSRRRRSRCAMTANEVISVIRVVAERQHGTDRLDLGRQPGEDQNSRPGHGACSRHPFQLHAAHRTPTPSRNRIEANLPTPPPNRHLVGPAGGPPRDRPRLLAFRHARIRAGH